MSPNDRRPAGAAGPCFDVASTVRSPWRPWLLLVGILSSTFALLLPACSDEGGRRGASPDRRDAGLEADVEVEAGPSCPVGSVPSPGPPPAFADDVYPILNGSCSGVGCHNDRFRTLGLFLGPSPDEPEATAETLAAVYASVVAPSQTAPALARVEPGAPEASFLMLKVDGCQAIVAEQCPNSPAERPCGSSMPLASPLLPAASRELLRRWIAGGAPGP